MPDEAEALALLALLLLHDSRREARVGADGALVLLEDQDRSRWSAARIEEGLRVLARARSLRRPGPYLLQAEIAARARAGGDRGGHRLAADRARSTPTWPRSRPRRWSSSTAPSPWRWRTGRRPGSRSSTGSTGSSATTSCTRRAPTCSAGSTGTTEAAAAYRAGARAGRKRDRAGVPGAAAARR